MNDKGISIMILSAIVGTILVMAVFVPIINTGLNPTSTFKNGSASFSQLNEVEDGEVINFSKSDTGAEWIVNDVAINSSHNSVLIMTDQFGFICNTSWNMETNLGELMKVDGTVINIPSGSPFSIVLNDGNYTITYGPDSTTLTGTYEWGFRLVPLGQGKYTTVYIDAKITSYDDVIMCSKHYWGIGNEIISTSGATFTIGGGVEVDGYESLIQFDSDNQLTFTQSNNTSWSPTTFVVPLNVIADKEVDTGGWGVLISILPMFVLICLLIGIVRGMNVRN